MVYEEDRCTCDEEDHEEHVCPFDEDVYDKETLCKCCPYCRQQCAEDI